jgi:hypothetical protein
MKLGVVFAIAALGASAASAAEPASVVGIWNPQKLDGVVALQALQFTRDGKVFSVPRAFRIIIPAPAPGAKPPAPPPLPQELIGQYETQGDKVIVRTGPGASATFELTKDGRLCVYPGPALMNGVVRRQPGERQCYERQSAERS